MNQADEENEDSGLLQTDLISTEEINYKQQAAVISPAEQEEDEMEQLNICLSAEKQQVEDEQEIEYNTENGCEIKENSSSISIKSAEDPLEEQQRACTAAPVRSSTPMSREMMALQRSINESKILMEFATNASAQSTRKIRKSNGKQIKIRYAPLKDADCKRTRRLTSCSSSNSMTNMDDSNNTSKTRSKSRNDSMDSVGNSRLGRSKSVPKVSPSKTGNNKNVNQIYGSDDKTSASKRTNMRSQNLDFVQKQKEFLSRVHRETDVADNNGETQILMDKDFVSLTQESAESSEWGNNSFLGARSNLSESNVSLHEAGIADDENSLEARLKPYWQTPPKVSNCNN